MRRMRLVLSVILAMLGMSRVSSAVEVPANRNWDGRFRFEAHVGGRQFEVHASVPGGLEASLDDVADTFNISAIDYEAEGSRTLDRELTWNSVEIIPPTDFPNGPTLKQITETLVVSDVEWFNVPSFADLEPAPLTYSGGWFALPETPPPLEDIGVRFIGTYTLTVDGHSETEPFELVVSVTPGELAPFYFSAGPNYPAELYMSSYPSFGPLSTGNVSIEVEGVTRSASLGAQFRPVPEPATALLGAIGIGVATWGFRMRRFAA